MTCERVQRDLLTRLLWMIVVSMAGLVLGDEKGGCAHPSVPGGAAYTNITGGLGEQSWKIKYICDVGFELFGVDERECEDGIWKAELLPTCSVNVARYKPAVASSVTGGGAPGNAVDGAVSTVHEGRRCTETKAEKSPWWAVDLLKVQSVKHVRITTRCCDDVPVKNIEIRVGNSTTYKDNPMCNWIPGSLPQGETKTVECVTEDANGRYVSLSMTGATGVLSLCEVEVFSPDGVGVSSCSQSIKPEEISVYDNACFWFVSNTGKEQDNLGFVEAAKTCDGVGYHLAYEIDEESASFMRYRLEAEGRADRGTLVWIGAERDPDKRGEAWNWVSGRPVRNIFWGAEQPNNYANEQNCAVLDSDLNWQWNDISCKVDAKTICKGPASRCPSPPVGEGTWFHGDKLLGASITYNCPVGYKPIGQQEQFCLSSGSWSGQPITCQFQDCGDVPGLLNGAIHVTDGRTTFGATIKYECNEDYSLMGGSQARQCDIDGWTGTPPKCEFTRCPDPGTVENADVKEIPGTAGNNRLGAKLIYTCGAGHVASGSLSRECQLGGTWSGRKPVCKFVDCGNPPELANGSHELVTGRTTYGAEMLYRCGDDYTIAGDTTRRCEANGRWTRGKVECKIISCPTPRSPSGGKVSGYNYEVHRKVEYSCFSGHRLEGDPVLQCQRSGQWSGQPPRCKYVDCGRVVKIEGGRISYLNRTTHLGSTVAATCDSSYKLSGPRLLQCSESGEWIGEGGEGPPAIRCTEIRCPLPLRPNNTVVSISSTERLHGTSVLRSKLDANITYKVGSQLKYRCERGHVLAGGQRVTTRMCKSSGTWTGTAPECSFVDCGRPDPVENGKFELQNNVTSYYGSMVFYKCDLGWKLKGFEKRSCLANGRWGPVAPLCEETLCKELSVPKNSRMNLTTLRIGGLATFSCVHGYSLAGDPDIECLSSGSWSGWPPACIEIDCGDPYKVDNSKVFLVDGSTKYGSSVEYHCDPGYTREGPFSRTCELNGYWSGQDPVCYIPRKVAVVPLVRDRDSGDVTTDSKESSASGVGVWIGVALGLVVIVGLLVVGIYFYRKQQALQTKPSRDNNANGLGVLGIPSYATQTFTGSQIGARPPPPIQMYSIEDTEDHRGPIYDTINDGDSGNASYNRSNGSENSNRKRSTFSPPGTQNAGYSNDYDVPEGGGKPGASVGTVTINGIAV